MNKLIFLLLTPLLLAAWLPTAHALPETDSYIKQQMTIKRVRAIDILSDNYDVQIVQGSGAYIYVIEPKLRKSGDVLKEIATLSYVANDELKKFDQFVIDDIRVQIEYYNNTVASEEERKRLLDKFIADKKPEWTSKVENYGRIDDYLLGTSDEALGVFMDNTDVSVNAMFTHYGASFISATDRYVLQPPAGYKRNGQVVTSLSYGVAERQSYKDFSENLFAKAIFTLNEEDPAQGDAGNNYSLRLLNLDNYANDSRNDYRYSFLNYGSVETGGTDVTNGGPTVLPGNTGTSTQDQGDTGTATTNEGDTGGSDGTVVVNPTKFNNIFELLEVMIRNVLLPLASVLAVLAIIWSGFLFITALGKPEKLVKAKRNFVYTLVGVVLLLGAYAFTIAVKNTVCGIVDIESFCNTNSSS